ncbi:MAG: hypothetical protein GWN45_05930, partial [Gammaproteobacteria bacterium]|nr:hypothetical protein [Gammaproteobacteria bacterium]
MSAPNFRIEVGDEPVNGTASIDALSGAWSYTPNADFNGTDQFTVSVTDDDGNVETQVISLTVTPVNDAPVLVNNGLTLDEGTTGGIGGSALSATDVDNTAAELRYTLTGTPGNGTLLLSGTPLAFGDFFTQADVDAGNIAYVHDGSEPLTTPADSFTFTLSDGAGGTLAGQTFDFSVTPVNDAPVNTVPGPLTTGLNTPVVFSGANVIAVSDVDAGVSPIEVDLVAANGTLNLAQTTGLTFMAGGDGTAAMTFRGTIADINAALDGMSFTPALAFEGAGASVQMTTNDLGNSGAVLAPQSDVSTVAITVINTPPTMSDQTLTVTENSAVGTLVGTVVASDPDLLDPLTYTIVPSVFSGAFSIDPATGEVFVVDASVLDFETNPTITLQVQVS